MLHDKEHGLPVFSDRRQAGAQPAGIENVLILKASPLHVWSVITDFAGHRHWKPFTQLAGVAAEGGDAKYSFRLAGTGKSVTTKADIIRVEKAAAFAWTAGVAKLLLFEETYELSGDPEGTRLHHSLRFSGILGRIATTLLRRNLQVGLVQSDECLTRRLRELAVPAGDKQATGTLRRGGRTRRHK